MVDGQERGSAAEPNVTDLIFAAAIVALSVVVWIGTADLPPPRYEPVGSAALPRGIALVMAALAVVVALKALGGGVRTAERLPLRAVARIIAIAGLLVVFVGIMDARVLGFRPAAAGFFFLAVLVMAGVTWRTVAAAAGFSLILALGIHVVFTRLFYIDLP